MNKFTNAGLFWTDEKKKPNRSTQSYLQPAIPETGWRPPAEFPNLSAATTLSFDVETYDPDLIAHGPGWARGSGHIVGIALGARDNAGNTGQWYFPIRHEVEPQHNMDPAQVLAFADHVLRDTRPKVGANLYYDLGWCQQEGIRVGGMLYDVQYAEALLNSEAPRVDLDTLALKHLQQRKQGSLLYRWLADYYGGEANDRQRANIHRSPPRLAGPYGEADAALPLQILDKQWRLLAAWNLLDVFKLECRLIPLLVTMRFQGVPVNIEYTQRLHDELTADTQRLDGEIRQLVGFDVNPSSGQSCAAAFDYFGMPYPRTDDGNPSFKAEFLEFHSHPLAALILERRRCEKIRGTFLQSYILDGAVKGRIHCSFHPLKGDGYGARSGRFSSSNPNLQNIPSRTEIGKRVRKAFVARRTWRKFDYSQIEYRLLAHHAVGEGAEDIRRKYRQDPLTDYHAATQTLVQNMTALEIERPKIKNINFGFIYGMSRATLRIYLGLTSEAADELFAAYHAAVPFAQATMRHYMELVETQGYVSTFAGRRSQFTKFVPQRFDRGAVPLEFEDAYFEYGCVRRAFAHKGLNRVLQGGAAEIMKRAMVNAYEQGVFAATGIPLLTVHDELDFDDDGTVPADAWPALVDIMENCAPEISVPIRVDQDTGANWGDAK